MAHGRVGRGLMGPLLVVNLMVNLIILGLAGWSLNKYIDGQQNHHHLGGNAATTFVLIFALLAGTLGAALRHMHAWRIESLASADSSVTISWAVMALAFGLVWKEIRIGGRRGRRLMTLEVFVIISTFIQLLCLLLLHAEMFDNKYGPTYGRYHNAADDEHGGVTSTAQEPDKPNTSVAG
ncbi:hypothetical protein Ancab_040263 [Ancistrocladus abbreviatus]